MPLFFPPQIVFELPEVASPAFEAWLDRWRDLAGAGYVRAIWEKHR